MGKTIFRGDTIDLYLWEKQALRNASIAFKKMVRAEMHGDQDEAKFWDRQRKGWKHIHERIKHLLDKWAEEPQPLMDLNDKGRDHELVLSIELYIRAMVLAELRPKKGSHLWEAIELWFNAMMELWIYANSWRKDPQDLKQAENSIKKAKKHEKAARFRYQRPEIDDDLKRGKKVVPVFPNPVDPVKPKKGLA